MQVNGGISYHCSCNQGYTGARCHISLGACAQARCLNGGTCVPIGDTSYRCTCLPGYSGTVCEAYNPCAARQCYYGGKCRPTSNEGFKCECPAGRSGKECAAGNYCHFTKCYNGGSCVEEVDGAYCDCPPGFEGASCEHDINECLGSYRCDSHEICVNTFGSYYCNCSSALQGRDCSMLAPSRRDEGFSMVLVVVGGLVLLVIVAVVIIAIICCRKRKYRYSQTDTSEFKQYPFDRYLNPDPCNNFELNSVLHHPCDVNPPPEYSDDQASAAAAMYDPSAAFSDPSLTDDVIDIDKEDTKFHNSRTSIECNSLSESESDECDNDTEIKSLPGYHWDYHEVSSDFVFYLFCIFKYSRAVNRRGGLQ